MKKETINLLFDLDGTIIDPAEGILNSIHHAFSAMQKPVPDRKQLLRFIGPPLIDSFSGIAGMSNEEALTAVEHYRQYFNNKGKFENTLYPGIRQVFDKAVSCGFNLFIATSKPTIFAKEIITHYALDDYFIETAGSNLDHTRREKAEIIRHLIQTHKLNTTNSWMIGDRLHDVVGARKCGVKSVGVNWGYAEENEWVEFPPDKIAETTAHLTDWVERL